MAADDCHYEWKVEGIGELRPHKKQLGVLDIDIYADTYAAAVALGYRLEGRWRICLAFNRRDFAYIRWGRLDDFTEYEEDVPPLRYIQEVADFEGPRNQAPEWLLRTDDRRLEITTRRWPEPRTLSTSCCTAHCHDEEEEDHCGPYGNAPAMARSRPVWR
jgi:hypothetical protein